MEIKPEPHWRTQALSTTGPESRSAFLGNAPFSLIDSISQSKRWAIRLLEVFISRYMPMVFGARNMGIVMGLCYAHNAFWPIWSIPITIYSFLPQLALLNGFYIFPKVTDWWFLLYVFLFLGAYAQDCYDFILFGSTYKIWWNDQRMWIIKGLSPYVFAFVEYTSKCLGIVTKGFNVTSKVQDDEQSKRYDQGLMEFGVHSPFFCTFGNCVDCQPIQPICNSERIGGAACCSSTFCFDVT
ncbi:putative cellulose synthase (UDP-forming) [Helianthus anomalus]